jgi:hypothetical protein
MKPSTGLKLAKLASFVALVALSGSALSGSLSAAQRQLTEKIDTKVIIILRDQDAGAPAARGNMRSRAAALANAQSSVLSELQQSNATRVHGFQMINALSATVSKSEVTRLSAHPLVKVVLPDRVIKAAPRVRDAAAAGGAGAAAAAASPASSSSGFCNTLEPQALQLTNTAFLDPAVPQAQLVRDGNGRYVTGEGVKVAYIADGIDPTVAGFTRTDGKPVFFDYQNFAGDPAGTPTPGGEAFGDASSIAAQDTPHGKVLSFDITQFEGVAGPSLPTPCNIRIRGMAPGARVAGLDVFSSLGFTTTSAFVQAIEYAVINDDVDVINESFGGNPYPDNDNDPISLADRAAVAAGVTVVASTGDAGTAGTIGTPATDPWVISAGATTQYRQYAQTGYPAPIFTLKGYLNNNISAFSSSGFAQTGARTVDVVAPGESGWALCSTNPTLFTDCTSDNGGATPIQAFGGTSEAAPLTSGEAALVIQAYRSTHGGATPSPALVKTIIMSTATDIGAPASEQGAGLINALGAVNAALSIGGGAHGQSVLHYPTTANATDLPNASESRTFTVTNYGSSVAHFSPSLQRLGTPFAGATIGLTLPATEHAVSFVNDAGAERTGLTQTFHVPPGAQHLDVSVAFHPDPTGATIPTILMALIDPSGKLADYNVEQGVNVGFTRAEVINPAAGTWTAYVYTHPADAETYAGPLKFTWAAERYVSFGAVWPANLTLAPGQSAYVTASFNMPGQAGDSGAALRFGAGAGEIPITLRTLIPVGASGGSFEGTLTGGNGRPGAGPTQTFAFNVPYGVENLSLSLSDSDPNSPLQGLLVDPNGMQMSVQPNADPTGAVPSGHLQLFHYNPQPGQWRFVLLQNVTAVGANVSGNETSLPFSGRISFYATSQTLQANLPANATLSVKAGPVTVPIRVTNNGTASQWYFLDARLRNAVVTQLPVNQFCTATTLQGTCFYVWVPPEATAVQFEVQTDKPVNMDVFDFAGSGVGEGDAPDVWALPVAKDTVAATLVVPEVPWGPWQMNPSLIGPYGSGGVSTSEPVAVGAAALMKPFDAAVSSDAGNIWADVVNGTTTFNPQVLLPGKSEVIHVTVTPNASQIGTTVNGYLYLETFSNVTNTGDQVARIPYSYTVTP